jgi:hypothetical protein
MKVAPRRCWPRQLSFTEYISSYRICSQLSVIWVIGLQFWRARTLSISTSHNPESCQYHVVPEQGRHRHYLSRILRTHPIRSYCPCTHCGKIEASSSYAGYRRVVHVVIRSSAASTSGLLEHAKSLVRGKCTTKPITFRISTRFVISIISSQTKWVDISCDESKTTSSRMHGSFRFVYHRHTSLTPLRRN